MSNDSTDLNPYLEELKAYLHIVTPDDDDNLNSMLKTAHTTLKRWCGSFDFTDDEGKQLAFDYVRYMKAGASEYFYPNFKSQISSFGFFLMEVPPDDEIFEEK